MKYTSTRNNSISITSGEAIVKGLSSEGGLFIPLKFPTLTALDIESFGKKKYSEIAFHIFKLFLTDFADEEIRYATEMAYGGRFDTEDIAEMSCLLPGTYLLELWHGPTFAFKDMALQILPYLLTISSKKVAGDKETVILVATSGDTGKAALEGFKDVEGTRIMVFYPEEGVSEIQKRQMITQEGTNVKVAAVKGNFDDCQNGVKEIFVNDEINKYLAEKNMAFSSANSINWGRLLPQIVYYISAYARLIQNGEIEKGEKINIAVPTGNFGNILAAYFAKEMGLPVNKLICASNENNILTEFINTGVYDRNRDFYTTISPSMDILISSNLERLLYLLSDNNDALINKWFESLKSEGKYKVSGDMLSKIKNTFYGGYSTEEETKRTIKSVFDNYSYLLDTHTAVAYHVYNTYAEETGDRTKTLIASTANPYKFVKAVHNSLTGENSSDDEFVIGEKLSEMTGMQMPLSLLEIRNKKIRFNQSILKEDMGRSVLEFIGGNIK